MMTTRYGSIRFTVNLQRVPVDHRPSTPSVWRPRNAARPTARRREHTPVYTSDRERLLRVRTLFSPVCSKMIAAGITAVGLVDYGRKAWMGVKAVRQTSNMVNKYRRAPEEMRFTFQLCACLLEALPVAEALATRYRSLAIVGTAVQMARNAVQQATSLFADDSVEDTDDGWAEFMKAGRKYESVQQLQSRLALAISSLKSIPSPEF